MLPHVSPKLVPRTRLEVSTIGRSHIYEEALAILKKLGSEAQVASYLDIIGSVYQAWGQYDKAIKTFEEALAIGKKLGRRRMLPHASTKSVPHTRHGVNTTRQSYISKRHWQLIKSWGGMLRLSQY